MSKPRICQGVFAINKPKSISSTQVLRDLQRVFNPSKFFAPWLEAQKADHAKHDRYRQRKRKEKCLQVKLGHGGTLDPMATGVLLVGVGKGTKQLQPFLECTKEYEATVLFGAATDTYDILGKILGRAPYHHVTEDIVESALQHFRGKIMQRPPIYSALRIQGKRLYKYAREGKEVPVEIQERPVEARKLEIIEWMNGDDHGYEIVSKEATEEEKVTAGKVLHLSEVAITNQVAAPDAENDQKECASGSKRKRELDEDENGIFDKTPITKRQVTDPQFTMSGALQTPDRVSPKSVSTEAPVNGTQKGPPAVKLRMTVTSGFYVRSLSHDLGKHIGSLGVMSELVRTRQGDFELGLNVLEYSDFSKSEEIWAPKIERMLEEWDKGISKDSESRSVVEGEGTISTTLITT